jgi:hypothetical protein
MASTRRLAGALMATIALVGACGESGTSPSAASTTTTTATTRTPNSEEAVPDPIIEHLCAVLSAAEEGDVELARSTFDHGPLHTLADKAIDIDRSVAARLLVAKEAVEADLANESIETADLAVDVDALVAATAEALTATGTPVTPTCAEDTP